MPSVSIWVLFLRSCLDQLFILIPPTQPFLSAPCQELGAALKAAEDQAAKLSKELIKARAEYDNKVGAREEEEKAKAALLQSISETEAAITAKQTFISQAGDRYTASQSALALKEEAIAAAERKVKAASMGMTEVDGEAKTFADQIREAESRASAAATQAQQAVMTAEHLQKQLAEKRPKGQCDMRQRKTNEKAGEKTDSGDLGRLRSFLCSQILPDRIPAQSERCGEAA